MAEQRMRALQQLGRVLCFEKRADPRHFVNGVAAEFRARGVRGFAMCFKLQPDCAFVGGDDFAAGRFANDCEVCLEFARGERAGTRLQGLFVYQTRKNDFSTCWALARFDQ